MVPTAPTPTNEAPSEALAELIAAVHSHGRIQTGVCTDPTPGFQTWNQACWELNKILPRGAPKQLLHWFDPEHVLSEKTADNCVASAFRLLTVEEVETLLRYHSGLGVPACLHTAELKHTTLHLLEHLNVRKSPRQYTGDAMVEFIRSCCKKQKTLFVPATTILTNRMTVAQMRQLLIGLPGDWELTQSKDPEGNHMWATGVCYPDLRNRKFVVWPT